MIKHFFPNLSASVLDLPRVVKRGIALAVDVCICITTVWLAYYLRLGEFISLFQLGYWSTGLFWAIALSIFIALPIFISTGFYRAIFRYSGWPAIQTVARALFIYSFIYASIVTVFGITGIPRTIGLIQPLLLFIFIGTSRLTVKYWLGGRYDIYLQRALLPKTLIYGAGESGRQLAAALENSLETRIVGFVDDNQRLHGHTLNGQPIYCPANIEQLIESKEISSVLLAMPSVSRKRRNEIIQSILKFPVAVRTLPSLNDLAGGKISTSDLKELDIDDLLGREPVEPDHNLLAKNISEKTVMVTGAGGSIGGELCRQILALSPTKLLLVEVSEFAVYSIHTELEKLLESQQLTTQIIPLLASVQNVKRINTIVATWKPDTIYHAAAYKHVPMVEHNLIEGIKNNVFGTLTVAKAAIEYQVDHFVLISTDKAVRPTNIMGASKRLAEMCLQALHHNQQSEENVNTKQHQTTFSMVRFGNVLGSSGSVIPKFRQQIRDGGPITLTHPDITRFFMTIPEAAQLVIQAGAMAKGGDVFVLDMGESVKIIDLASRMIELSGLTVQNHQNPEGDIAIEITGLRPGEKLYEELLIGDNPETTSHSRILRARDQFTHWPELTEILNSLTDCFDSEDIPVIRKLLINTVTGFQPDDQIVDWVYSKKAKLDISS